ncbi:Trehalose utilization [Rubripirellula tenax]|uniref:Trehalose utilization n=1 Tax=Rubripirellula tenax TaxID=2528015 RepID=A0A5C6F2R6_9BACT|nr:ThuA domain-containing protein [Rubripirellula tenax]TWU54316.1 Trehalose utilization [Rubripirellula tenax]
MFSILFKTLAAITIACTPQAEPLGEYWGTGEAESAYYELVDVPLPKELAIEAGSFEVMPDEKSLAIATRRGDIFVADGVFDEHPEPKFFKFAEGLDEIFGLAYRDGSFIATQQAEVSRITDVDGDGRADRFDTISDAWGFGNYHEFAFGSKPDADGNVWVALCLTKSYHSDEPFRGWCLKITPEGKSIPICSGIRSPCGIGPNEHGVMFYAESQGPWNGSCSLKVLEPGGFMGHPISFNWYELAPEMGPVPVEPNTPSRLETERKRVKQLVPYAVVFPYIRMGRSISGFQVDRTGGKFGPFANQIFIGDFSLGVVMRATTEKVNGVWQGACYPFREGFDTGLLAVQFTPDGSLIAGGTNRGWPVRGPKAYAIQRLDWTGLMPFEIKEIKATPQGFELAFTKPVDRDIAAQPQTYQLKTFTHMYRQAYGSPEVDQTEPQVSAVNVADDAMSVVIKVNGLVQGHVHDFFLPDMRSSDDDKLLHANAYYTLNEIPNTDSAPKVPSGDSSQSKPWLHFKGGVGPGKGKHVVLIAAEQEYRSEQSMPMLAKVLAKHHGFDCTVLFSVNENGEVDPTIPAPFKDKEMRHHIPGLDKLSNADCLIWMSRFMHLPDDQMKHFHDYFDSGKPIIALRTANHGFQFGKDYVVNDRVVGLRELLGGAFSGHHGGWHRESTRGIVVDDQKNHPILTGVGEIWGTSDVYRCHTDQHPFPEDCTALVLGQPLVNLEPDAPANTKKEPLPIAWIKTWRGSQDRSAKIFHFTMGSAEDFANEGVRRLTVNAVYWGVGMEGEISEVRSVEVVGDYKPLAGGFNYQKLGVKPRKPEFYK